MSSNYPESLAGIETSNLSVWCIPTASNYPESLAGIETEPIKEKWVESGASNYPESLAGIETKKAKVMFTCDFQLP